MCVVYGSTCFNREPPGLHGAGPLEHGGCCNREQAADTERGAQDILRQGGEVAVDRQEGLGWKGPRRHTWVPQRRGRDSPRQTGNQGRGGGRAPGHPPNSRNWPNFFLKGLYGSEGRGGGRGRTRRPSGGPYHLPHSRQPSVAPEPGRKQEVGKSRGRKKRGRDGGSDRGVCIRTDAPMDRWGSRSRPPPLPPAGESTRGSAPRQS